MERRLNKKLDDYISSFKDDIREKAGQLGMNDDNNKINYLLQYIYDYDKLSFDKEDLQKRKRVKNFVPLYERCCAKRANNEQCTRRKKDGLDFCGTHGKGTPHGITNSTNNTKSTIKNVDVFAYDFKGIIYYVDKCFNVYQTEDIVNNNPNPKIIAKYIKTDDVLSIPEFNI